MCGVRRSASDVCYASDVCLAASCGLTKYIVKNRVKAVFNYDKAKYDDAKIKNFFSKSPIKGLFLIRLNFVLKFFLKRVLTRGISCVKI